MTAGKAYRAHMLLKNLLERESQLVDQSVDRCHGRPQVRETDVGPITPQTHPRHPVVGRTFIGHDGRRYFCDSFDPQRGYWMTEIDDFDREKPTGRRANVAERAINRTFFFEHENGHRLRLRRAG